jgi:hypothetical protein
MSEISIYTIFDANQDITIVLLIEIFLQYFAIIIKNVIVNLDHA